MAHPTLMQAGWPCSCCAALLTPFQQPQVSRLEQATLLPSFYAEDTPVAANETWARLHADPLFAIRQQEVSARKQVVQNPAQMLRIKQQVGEGPTHPTDDLVVLESYG